MVPAKSLEIVILYGGPIASCSRPIEHVLKPQVDKESGMVDRFTCLQSCVFGPPFGKEREEMDWVDYLNTGSAVMTAAAAVVATVIGLWQFRQAKQLEFQDKRAFIVPRLTINKDSKMPRVYLVIHNAGDTPAKNIVLEFREGQVWNWVKPANFPFLEDQGGITALSPGAEMSFFLGEIRRDNVKFNDIEKRDILGVASFDHPVRKGKRVRDEFRLSLQDNRYQSNPNSK